MEESKSFSVYGYILFDLLPISHPTAHIKGLQKGAILALRTLNLQKFIGTTYIKAKQYI